MNKPTLRGVLLASLLVAGAIVALIGGVAGHLEFRRLLERNEASRAKSLATAVVSIAESATDGNERLRLILALAADGDAAGLALLGGEPVRVLAGTQAAWTGR